MFAIALSTAPMLSTNVDGDVSIATGTGQGSLASVALIGDFDGDGKADPVVWQPSTGTWHIIQSSTGVIVPMNFDFEPAHFGIASTMRLEQPKPTWVMTNVLTFPWNAFTIDGRNAQPWEIRSNSGRTAIHIPSGTHEITVQFSPPRLWRFLRIASLVALYSWALYLFAVGLIRPRSSRSRSSQSAIMDHALLILALYLPCRFLAPLEANYYVDWGNHQWAIGYFGEYFRQHHTMPASFSTPQLSGLADPVFYGHLFYPLLGLPSSVLAPGVVIRLGVIVIFWAQYRLVSQVALRLGAPPYLARIVACTVIWAIYPLTNLYNRSALTEFFATALLVCALNLWILLFCAKDANQQRRYACGMVFTLTMAAGTHPITAVYGVPMIIGVAVLFFCLLGTDRSRPPAILRATWPWIAIGLVCMLPWIFVMTTLGDTVAIRHAGDGPDGLPRVLLFEQSIDHVLTRFHPFPYDRRVTAGVPLDQISTPYLDAQINVPLLILVVVLGGVAVRVGRRERGPLLALGIAMTLFALFTWLSLSSRGYTYLPAAARMIQTAYRIVTYQNLSLLLGLFLSLMALRSVPAVDRVKLLHHPAMMAVALGCAVLSVAGVIVKWSHIRAVQRHDNSPHWILAVTERAKLIDLPGSYYGFAAYSTPSLFTPLPPDVVEWGTSGDVPMAGDYDGDGKADVAVFRPSTGVWYIIQSSNGAARVDTWGMSGDIPLAGDVDGDGKTDLVIWRPSTGAWYIKKSSGGDTAFPWGTSGDLPLLGDFDGDGKADLTVYRPTTGVWFVQYGEGGGSVQMRARTTGG